MDYLDRVIECLDSYRSLGTRLLDNGTRLIGHVPHVAPEAWFHAVFTPISTESVRQLEQQMGINMPENFSNFLIRANGLRVFSGHLYIRGLRWNFSRRGDDVWQPFSILTPNLEERPRNAKKTHLFMGGYEPSGSMLYIDINSLNVYRCTHRSAKPLYEWSSFEDMLESEVQRLTTRFDRDGRLLDPAEPTTPKNME